MAISCCVNDHIRDNRGWFEIAFDFVMNLLSLLVIALVWFGLENWRKLSKVHKVSKENFCNSQVCFVLQLSKYFSKSFKAMPMVILHGHFLCRVSVLPCFKEPTWVWSTAPNCVVKRFKKWLSWGWLLRTYVPIWWGSCHVIRMW